MRDDVEMTELYVPLLGIEELLQIGGGCLSHV